MSWMVINNGINASFLRKIDSGTGQVTANFLRQLVKDEKAKKEEDRDHFILYLEEDFSWSEIGLEEETDKSFFQNSSMVSCDNHAIR